MVGEHGLEEAAAAERVASSEDVEEVFEAETLNEEGEALNEEEG